MKTASPRLPARLTGMLAAALILATTAGCDTLNGYDASSQFHCKAPAGVQCQSLSGVYANSQGNRPAATQQTVSQQAPQSSSRSYGNRGRENESPSYSQLPALSSPAAHNMGEQGQPPTFAGVIRSEPTTIRTWVMAYRDVDGDVVDQLYIYMALDSGNWLLQHEEQTIREIYAPAKPTRLLGSGAKTDSDAALGKTAATGTQRASQGAGTPPLRPASGNDYGLDGNDGVEQATERRDNTKQSDSSVDPNSVVRRIQEAMQKANAAQSKRSQNSDLN